MCLAIFKPPGKDLTEAQLKSGWMGNPGGAGFCHIKNGRVVIEKGFMKLQDFLAAYNAAAKKNKKSPFLVHFRIPSMGHNLSTNTHPFEFTHGALIHNGTITGTGATHGTGPSDTAKFVERYGDKLTFANVEKLNREIGRALGYNKIAILYHDGTHQIINESEGAWIGGVWFSNRLWVAGAERFAGE